MKVKNKDVWVYTLRSSCSICKHAKVAVGTHGYTCKLKNDSNVHRADFVCKDFEFFEELCKGCKYYVKYKEIKKSNGDYVEEYKCTVWNTKVYYTNNCRFYEKNPNVIVKCTKTKFDRFKELLLKLKNFFKNHVK